MRCGGKRQHVPYQEVNSGDIDHGQITATVLVATYGGVMTREPIPEDVRRFILTSITSVPYLEAMLLLRNAPNQSWDRTGVARRLYVSAKAAGELLSDLCAAGFLVVTEPETPLYRYHPRSDELREMIDQLAEAYAKNLIEVTNLIHSKTGKKEQQFADAFRWRKDS
jgi:hypothetical protein